MMDPAGTNLGKSWLLRLADQPRPVARLVFALALLSVWTSACSIINNDRLLPQPTSDRYLDIAPECRRQPAVDLCEELRSQLHKVNGLDPGAREVGRQRVGPTGDGRYLLTVALVSHVDEPDLVANHFRLLSHLGWTAVPAAQNHQLWKGTGDKNEWLIELAFAPEGEGTKITVAIYAPGPES